MEEEIESQGQTESSNPVKMGGGATNFRPWLFQKGKSGNPGGMKKGTKSLKVFVREYLASLPDEDKIEFMEGLPKDILWRMGEGQPHQSTDLDVKGGLTIQFAKEFDKKTPIDAPTTPETKPEEEKPL